MVHHWLERSRIHCCYVHHTCGSSREVAILLRARQAEQPDSARPWPNAADRETDLRVFLDDPIRSDLDRAGILPPHSGRKIHNGLLCSVTLQVPLLPGRRSCVGDPGHASGKVPQLIDLILVRNEQLREFD